MNETLKVTDSRGIPTMKALWMGVILDGDEPPNRHLEFAGLQGKEIFLELVEVAYDPNNEEEDDEDEEDDGDPIEYALSDVPEGMEEDEVEECTKYLVGCLACLESECTGPDCEISDEDETYVALDIAYREKSSDEWIDFPDEELAANVALCRFLNALNETHGL